MKNLEIANNELTLNIKYQDIKIEKFLTIGYKFDENTYVFMLVIPIKELGFKPKGCKLK